MGSWALMRCNVELSTATMTMSAGGVWAPVREKPSSIAASCSGCSAPSA